jgi:hypothetical protein
MPTRLLMLDSGAYSVWRSGAKIDINEYISFCQNNPAISYYVNLDVIPGTASSSPTAQDIEDAAAQGWKNYMQMVRKLDFCKVVPVFHRRESLKWLEKMLEVGCPYIGLGGTAGSVNRRAVIKWFDQVRGIITNSDGKPIVRTHGFGINSLELLRRFPWYSVDSAGWLVLASFGKIWIPRKAAGQFDFNLKAAVVAMTPQSGWKGEFQIHYDTMLPVWRKQVEDWLQYCGVPLGQYEVVNVPLGYEKAAEVEQWADKTKTKVVREIVAGVRTRNDARRIVNATFIKHQEHLDRSTVEHIYFAGCADTDQERMDRVVTKRLYTFANLGKLENGSFCRHLEAIRQGGC